MAGRLLVRRVRPLGIGNGAWLPCPGGGSVQSRWRPGRDTAIDRALVLGESAPAHRGYSSEQRIDRRAVPLIGIWIVVGTVLIWIQLADRPLASNVGSMILALALTGTVIGGFLWVRKHPPFGSLTRLDLLDIAVVGLVPGLVASVVTGDQAP